MDIIKYTSKIVKYLTYIKRRKKYELINDWIFTTINHAGPSLSSVNKHFKTLPSWKPYGLWHMVKSSESSTISKCSRAIQNCRYLDGPYSIFFSISGLDGEWTSCRKKRKKIIATGLGRRTRRKCHSLV